MSVTLSIVVPCYNEAANLPPLLERFRAVFLRDDVELVVVDNGSTDPTPALLAELLPQVPFARTVRVPVNRGYGFGIRAGLAAARGDFLGWTHADLQTDPADTIAALSVIESSARPQHIFVKGSRRGRPAFDTFFTVGMSCFESVYLGARLWDINAQPNLFHRSFLDTWQSPPDDFSLDLYALWLARRQGLELVRVPVRFESRLHGTSHWNTSLGAKWKFIRRTIAYSRQLKRGLSP